MGMASSIRMYILTHDGLVDGPGRKRERAASLVLRGSSLREEDYSSLRGWQTIDGSCCCELWVVANGSRPVRESQLAMSTEIQEQKAGWTLGVGSIVSSLALVNLRDSNW